MSDPLDLFHPAVSTWFRRTYGEATPPQVHGWPAIQRGENTLILSPTGSGKTMAAFLWGISRIYTQLAEKPDLRGVKLLYISPLKALNNDIERNLRVPLAGIREMAAEMGSELPPLRVAVRTGDTPSSHRQRMVRKPPHILITTPESLYLLLTSPRAREILTPIETVIVDEIHTLCGNKRGVHLGLSLERLGARTSQPFQRIGLSATQRPLDEVARFLVGQEWAPNAEGEAELVSRAITLVDAGIRKDMDLRVVTTVPDLRHLPHGSIWPHVIPDVLGEIRRHRTTLIFSNSRRGAEQASDRLNEQFAQESNEEIEPGSPAGLLVDGVPVGKGLFGTGRTGGPFYAHHGSISKERRLMLETQLKNGELPALIGTSSLELGIDIGSVDVVVQLQSPRSVARGLQRVGRSGHLVGQTSVGRIYATHREDLLDAGAVAHGMLEGDIEPTYTPLNCLDVLAQQIVAAVAMDDWPMGELYDVARRAYGYQELPWSAFEAVVKMLSGHYPADIYRELRPRIAWDRVHDVLSALPGSRMLATRNGGTIPDRGQFRVYLPDQKTLLGTLDEEFVYETSVSDVITFGSSTWRVLEIDEDKMVVADAGGSMPRMPFWHGELPKRSYHTGQRLGAFRRELVKRLSGLTDLPDDPNGPWPPDTTPIVNWLETEYAMDEASARNAMLYVWDQVRALGAVSSDRTVIVEQFTDALGDSRLAIHSCFGARINSAWALALVHAMRDRLGLGVEPQVNDDGILFRFLEADRDPPIDLIREMSAEEARERVLLELPNSALFGAEFRMNAARALLLPGVRGAQRRTPFWLQRLRARELLTAVRQFDDFPILTETFRDCVRDVLDVEHLAEVLEDIRAGDIRVVVANTLVPSVVAAGLLFSFAQDKMYEWDTPLAERQAHALAVNRELLAELLDEGSLPDLLRPAAVEGVADELQHLAEGYGARSAEELVVLLHELGDLTGDEVLARASPDEGRRWLLELAAEGRILSVTLPTAHGPEARWIAAEDYARYRDAFQLGEAPPVPLPDELLEPHREPETARDIVLRVYARCHGPFTRDELTARYAFPDGWLDETLEILVSTGYLVTGRLAPGAEVRQWCDRRVLERIHRTTLAILRNEIKAVPLEAFADFVARWQGAHIEHGHRDEEGLAAVLTQLRGVHLPAALWERDVLPARVGNYSPSQLDALCDEGDLTWQALGADARYARTRFFYRGEGGYFCYHQPEPEEEPTGDGENDGSSPDELGARVLAAIERLGAPYGPDLARELDVPEGEVSAALAQLLLRGDITNDRYDTMRRLIAGEVGETKPSRSISSSLDADLAAWRERRRGSASATRPGRPFHRPSQARLQHARRTVQARVSRPRRWGGRWVRVNDPVIRGSEPDDIAFVETLARQFLIRYGIVTRQCLANEELDIDWAVLYRHYRRMEMRGEVRRGYFVQGLPGIQFSLPEAVEDLRAWRRPDAEGADELVLLNACDPASVYGPGTWNDRAARRPEGQGEGEEATDTDNAPDLSAPLALRFSRLPSNYYVMWRGQPIVLYEHGGEAWSAVRGLHEGRLREAIEMLRQHLTARGGLCGESRRLRVATWNGEPPVGAAAQSLLESLGFRRETPAMVWDGM